MVLELLFDDMLENYLWMYNEEVLDDFFGFGLEIECGFYFVIFVSEINWFEVFVDVIIDILRWVFGEFDVVRD